MLKSDLPTFRAELVSSGGGSLTLSSGESGDVSAYLVALAQGEKGEDGEDGQDGIIDDTFELYSKNLKSYPYALSYTGEKLTSITYTTPDGSVVKTLNYTGDELTSIVLSGAAVPAAINKTKTLSYTSGKLTGVAYS